MRSATPLLGLLRTAALIGLVLVLAACGRNGTGVGIGEVYDVDP